MAKVISWIRKGIGIFFGFNAVGAFQRDRPDVGIPVLLICTILLTPLDTLVFGQASQTLPFDDPRRQWRTVVIVLGRNAGWLLYASGIFMLTDRKYDHGVFLLLTGGMVLLFTRPVLLGLAPYRLVPATVPGPGTAPVPADFENGPLEQNDQEELITPDPSLGPSHQQAPARPDLATLKEAYLGLLQLPPHTRGYAFQNFLYQLFAAHQITARSAFRLKGEEIDGSFDIGPQTYLLEAKWHAKPTAQSDLLVFNSKVEGKSTWARGLFISYAGFTDDGLKAFGHGKRTSIIGMDGNDLLFMLDAGIGLEEAIRKKAGKAVENNDFFVALADLA